MAGFDENLVREYFELNGFLVRQLRKYLVQSRRKRVDEQIDLLVFNPAARESGEPLPFQLFSTDIARIKRAIVVVKGWHTSRFTPTMLKSSSRVFDFLKKDVLSTAEQYFSFDPEANGNGNGGAELPAEAGSFTKILVLPSLPASDPQRAESIRLLQEGGVDAIVTFGTILENLLRKVEINHSYQKSDLLQLMRILKIYDMVKDPQMQLFQE